jgi:hypothetical protein
MLRSNTQGEGTMHTSTTTTIFLYLVIFCIGAAIGALIERAMKGRSTQPPALPPSNNNKLANEGDVEILSAWRTRNNKVWLGMNGNRMDNKAALQPGQYQRLLSLVLDLRPWLETVEPAAPEPESVPQPVRPVAPAPVVTQPPVQAGKKKSALAGEGIKSAPVLESIIQQIDKVLQAKLATSEFKDRGIQLIEGPGGIVIVKDGINRYEGVDVIPDPEVKTLIRQAVADWEKGPK